MNKRNKVLFFKPLLNWLLGHCYIVFLVVLTGIISFILIFEKNDVLTFITSHNFLLSVHYILYHLLSKFSIFFYIS